MPYPYDRPLPSSRIPDDILYPRTFDGCVAAAIVFAVSETNTLPRLVPMANDDPGCREPWPKAPEPDLSKAALLGVSPHGGALWWFSIDGSERMTNVFRGQPDCDEDRHIRNWTRPSLARLVAETFEHRMRLTGLTAGFEPWLALADRFAAMGAGETAAEEPEYFIHHALLFREGKPDIAAHIVRSIALGTTVDDLAYAPYVRDAAMRFRDTLPDTATSLVRATPHMVPLTRENLWFLYRFLDMIKAEIESITGWSRGQIDYGIRKWDLSNWSPSAIDTRLAVTERVAKAHGIPMTFENTENLVELADQEIARIRKLVLSGGFSWEPADGASDDVRPAELLAGMEKSKRAA